MKTLIKSTIFAATVTLSALTSAQAQQVELVTGIGFGNSQPEAMQNAVRAWLNQAIRDYGTANWNTSAKGPMTCSQLASGGGGAAVMGIGVEGDVSGNWTCSVSGVPL